MLKSVMPKLLFVLAIVGIIAAGNYFFPEEPSAATRVTKPQVEETAEEPAEEENYE